MKLNSDKIVSIVTPITLADLAAIMARPETGLLEKPRKKKARKSAAVSKQRRDGTKGRGGGSTRGRGRGTSRVSAVRS